MTAITAHTVYLHIAHVIGRQLPNAEITPAGNGAWIQQADRWIHIEAEFTPGEVHFHKLDWTIQRGFEAGADLFGGEHFDEPPFRVRGFKFGVLPKTMQWIKTGTSPSFH